MSKRLGGNIGCQDKTSAWHFIGSPDGSSMESTVSIMFCLYSLGCLFYFCQSSRHKGDFFLSIVLVVRAGLFE